jgi:tRNA U34 5-methylaminomethyl-2-thiouridine-forming methyltransferase MnmC
MNYVAELHASNYQSVFETMHQLSWNETHQLSSNFKLTKRQQFFQEINYCNQFDLIYFDAFGFRVQPELWSLEIFQKMYAALKPGGILVTYACRSSIKNAMLESGFKVEKLPGAPGKREMLRAKKI